MQQRQDAVYLDLPTSTMQGAASIVADAARDECVVVAHSHGAVAAVLALALGARPRALVLAEPALYDVARGHPVIEQHIATVEHARALIETGGLQSYWRVIRPLMFGGDADDAAWAAERDLAQRFSTVVPPWGFGIAPTDIASLPTLVVTGGWNAEYEAIADALEGAGATRFLIDGAQHRPQDDPRFAAVIERALTS